MSYHYNWQNLPDNIFGDIMMMVYFHKFDKRLTIRNREYTDKIADKCRQVCRSWNWMIMQITKSKKDKVRTFTEILVEKIGPVPPRWQIITYASLAHHGLLGSMDKLCLDTVDLATIPADLLASLISCSREEVRIRDVKNCDMISLLDSVQCEQLKIGTQSLSSEETLALVRAMESRVERLKLAIASMGEITLDMAVLSQYSGLGKCYRVLFGGVFLVKYYEEVRSWAKKIKWREIRNWYSPMLGLGIAVDQPGCQLPNFKPIPNMN